MKERIVGGGGRETQIHRYDKTAQYDSHYTRGGYNYCVCSSALYMYENKQCSRLLYVAVEGFMLLVAHTH